MQTKRYIDSSGLPVHQSEMAGYKKLARVICKEQEIDLDQ